jgi:hypothetical protein
MEKDNAIGVYFGEVVDVLDPLKLGRIKVRTPHYIGSSTSSIPWAMYGGASGGGSHNTGFYFIPAIGAQVLVAFVQGHVEYPVWLGGVPGNDPTTGEADTHVSTLDETSPYGQSIENWDHTLFNSISTQSGHRIVMDDNLPRNESDDKVNARRILLETSSGMFIRMIEAKTLEPEQFDSLLELGTVREDKTWIRRLALDDEDRNITLIGPDSEDDGQHTIEISSVDDFVSITTSRDYVFRMDDQQQLIDLHTSSPEGAGSQLIFDNPERSINIKSYDAQSGMTIIDGDDGYANLYMPHGVEPENSNAAIGIKYNNGAPIVYMTNGLGLGQSGFASLANGERVALWAGGASGSTFIGPVGASTQMFVESINGVSRVYIGKGNSFTLSMDQGSNILRNQTSNLVTAPTSTIIGTTQCVVTGGFARMTLVGSSIIMTNGSGITHDYFLHTHAVSGDGSLARAPNPGVNGFLIAGTVPVIGVVQTSYPGS